jgi:uncharacterized protein YjiS (DUF1127 family)
MANWTVSGIADATGDLGFRIGRAVIRKAVEILTGMCKKLWFLVKWYVARRALSNLANLDDRILKEVGVTRGEVLSALTIFDEEFNRQ